MLYVIDIELKYFKCHYLNYFYLFVDDNYGDRTLHQYLASIKTESEERDGVKNEKRSNFR